MNPRRSIDHKETLTLRKAQGRGWYAASADGEERFFPSLMGAMKWANSKYGWPVI